ncbi:hypothetical protein RAF48_15805 [Klebsiella pneumoniae]|jgi:hypothetical protein|uniref:hypothetical protein n=1 Tax=Klebsiella pneumoniae TaxID=573 RepID=UPI0022EA33BA|nr:hypothetical protein [Klebsiella pneumoniae]MDO6862158.1 hypothetical protein [Klebsiella pneumoniae]HBR1008116.1 hypothetical protein [Klebsiella pneumoniae]HBX5937033.1 hypothetical protein [Klebsiella pneumoniae]HBY5540203.1 hypothetical protein [Klebsiella pneumoniae]HDS6796815.1 hypothetical protein [Klebsiella pneumoniae]
MMNWDNAKAELDSGKKARFKDMREGAYVVKMTYTDDGIESYSYVIVESDDLPRFWRDAEREEGESSESWVIIS